MENKVQLPQMTPAERETENEANRLMEQIENALATVAIRSYDDGDSLEAVADRLERASHDLASAIRELARERRTAEQEGGWQISEREFFRIYYTVLDNISTGDIMTSLRTQKAIEHDERIDDSKSAED